MATEFIVEPDVVYVLDKNEVHIAEFKKDDVAVKYRFLS